MTLTTDKILAILCTKYYT